MTSIFLLQTIFLQGYGLTPILPAQSELPTHVLVQSDKYSFEIPRGWIVGKETPWGARDITPSGGTGKLGAMTAGPTKASWEELYRTSLYFIQREEKGKETPFRVGKTKQGYECMSFEVAQSSGFVDRRYTLLKNSAGNALALSVKIPSIDKEKQYLADFKRMVDSAKLK
ncbi:MAG: hypothetical protein WCG75_10415 [Armatimonadota bacterium]